MDQGFALYVLIALAALALATIIKAASKYRRWKRWRSTVPYGERDGMFWNDRRYAMLIQIERVVIIAVGAAVVASVVAFGVMAIGFEQGWL